MSFDEDRLDEKGRSHETPESTTLTRLDLTQKQLDHIVSIAKLKEAVGVPLSERDRFALKMAKLQTELKEESGKKKR